MTVVRKKTKAGIEPKKKPSRQPVLRPEVFRAKKRPGPPGSAAPVAPERDLADAATILGLVDKGSLKVQASHPNESLKSAKKIKRISADEEAELASKVQKWGDIEARNILVLANIGLVHLVANQFSRPAIRYEDLVQEGMMGLIRATESFEPHRGVRFSTYSVYWIRAKIQRHLQRLERDDNPNIVGAEIVVDEEGRKRRPKSRKLSIERSLEDEESRSLSEIIPANTDDPEWVALQREKVRAIKDTLEEIVTEIGDPRLKIIIEGRLLAEEPETLSALGERLHLSREGARLLESKMLKLARARLAKWRRNR